MTSLRTRPADSSAAPTAGARGSRARSLLWSAAEGLSQRGATAIATFVLAALTGPSAVGAVAAVVLAIGVYQAGAEVPLRQSGQRLVLAAGGERRLRRWSRVAGAAGFAIVATTLGVMSLGYVSGATAVALLPFVLVPIVSSLEVGAVVRLQQLHRWALLASARTVSGVVALAVGVTVALLTHSPLAMAVQFLLAELIFAAAVIRAAHRSQSIDGCGKDSAFRGDFTQTAVSSLLSWSRGQTDRVGIGVLAPPSVLGSYSLATAMSRAPAEAVLSGTANALRVHLAQSSDVDLRAVVTANERRMQVLMVASAFASAIGVYAVAQFLLGPKWDGALQAVPIFIASVFATAHALVCGVLLNHLGLSRRAYSTQAAEALLSLGIAAGALVDLRLGAILFLVRECSAALAMSWWARHWITRRAMLLWGAPTCASLLVLALLAVGGFFA